MKIYNLIGIVLIVLGSLALAYQGITYVKSEEVLDIGPLEIQAESKETIPLPPVIGLLAIAGGIGLVVYGSRKS